MSEQKTEPQTKFQVLQNEREDASVSTDSGDSVNRNGTETSHLSQDGIDGISATNSDTKAAVPFKVAKKDHNSKPRPFGASSTKTAKWSEYIIEAIDFFTHMVQFGIMLSSSLLKEAAKEATEEKTIAGYYVLLYTTPALSLFMMDLSVWLPHYFPGISMAAVLWWICNRIICETDPSLLLEAETNLVRQSKMFQNQAGHHSSNNANKKKTRHQPNNPGNTNTSSYDRDPTSSTESSQLRLLHSIEARICYSVVQTLSWSLPLLVFVHSVVGPPPVSQLWEEEDNETGDENLVPSIRLVAAYGLAVLKTHNILSPVAWVSGAIQILCVLTSHKSQSYIQRWGGVQILVVALGLASLRFMRLHGTTALLY